MRMALKPFARSISTAWTERTQYGPRQYANKEKFGKNYLAVTPGIRPAWTVTEKEDQQRITTPAQAVSAGADYLVIGRPIRDSEDPVRAAARIAAEIEEVL